MRSTSTTTRYTVALAALALVSACSTDEIPTSPGMTRTPVNVAAAHASNEVIVKFRAGASAESRAAVLRAGNATVAERIVTAAMRAAGDTEGLTLVRTGLGVAGAIEQMSRFADVEYAEPNYVYTHTATSNDPYYTNGSLWGMYGDATSPANQYGSQAGEAWAANHNSCSSVWVGIIDEGYMYTHEDLAANAGTNPGEVAGNGVDDDGNGYVDDVYGWDFDGGNNTVFDGTGDDHGTHVAGTIGGVGGNSKGVAGVCWSVKLFNAKFLGRNGGTTANAVKSVDYMTDMKTRHNLTMVATNNSWGGGGFSQALLDAINRGGNAGILFVAAAGNGGSDGVGDNNDNSPHYPSNYECTNGGARGWDCVISVAAIQSDGAKAGFSNYGVTSVDLGAPGRGIYSTVPASSRGRIVSSYASYGGTSMATPHVSGAAALYKAHHSTATAQNVRDAIMASTTPTSSLSGITVTGGRLNVSTF